MNGRVAILIFAAAAAAMVIGSTVIAKRLATPKEAPAATSTTSSIGGQFRLIDQNGKPVTDADLKGKPTAIFFGFTYCPEICPTTLTHVGQWLKQLGPDADRLNVVFVSIDPERDTPAQLKLYLSSFDSRIRGLSGTPEQIADMAKAYKVYYRKVPIEGGEYTMDHATMIYLFDRQMRFSELIRYEQPTDQALTQLRKMLSAKT